MTSITLFLFNDTVFDAALLWTITLLQFLLLPQMKQGRKVIQQN